jgi:hypothetical protein
MSHDAALPYAPLLPCLSARTGCGSDDAEFLRDLTLFIPPVHFSRLFAAIENDYVALAHGIRNSGNSIVSSTVSRPVDDMSPLVDLKRLTLRSKRFGFQMVPCDAMHRSRSFLTHCRVICSILASALAALYLWPCKFSAIRHFSWLSQPSLLCQSTIFAAFYTPLAPGTRSTLHRLRLNCPKAPCGRQLGFISASACSFWQLDSLGRSI